MTNFSVAVTRKWKDNSGAKQEDTTWFRVACHGKLGEVADGYVKKGMQVMVVGRVKARVYLDNNKQPAVSLDVIADTLQMLGSGEGGKRDNSDFGGDSMSQEIPFQASSVPGNIPDPISFHSDHIEGG